MSAEKDRLLDHDVDGIQEFDNPIPLWMTLVFVACIAFSVVYVPVYHILHLAPLPGEVYAKEAEAAAQIRKAASEKASHVDLAALAADPAALEAGKVTFQTYCIACHGEHGEGKIGPNLTDTVWIHGGEPADVVKTVSGGVLEKGMPAWGPVLGPEGVQKVVVYLRSLPPVASAALPQPVEATAATP